MTFFGLAMTPPLPPFLEITLRFFLSKIYRFETNKICNVIFWNGNDPPIFGEPVVPYQLRVLDARDATTHLKRGQLEPIFTKILLHQKKVCDIFLQTRVSVHSSSLVSSGSLTKVISDGLAFCQTQHPAFCPSDLPPPLSLLHNK